MHLTFLGPLGLYVLAAGGLSVSIAARSRDRTADSGLPLRIALVASLVAILTVTLTPASGTNNLQLVPVVHIFGRLFPLDNGDLVNVVGNLGLFLPLGAALCLLGVTRGRTILTGVCLSTSIEITQLFIPGRTTSIDDVLLNSLSTLLGFALVARWSPARLPPARTS